MFETVKCMFCFLYKFSSPFRSFLKHAGYWRCLTSPDSENHVSAVQIILSYPKLCNHWVSEFCSSMNEHSRSQHIWYVRIILLDLSFKRFSALKIYVLVLPVIEKLPFRARISSPLYCLKDIRENTLVG